MNSTDKFNACTKHSNDADSYRIECVKGLWSVDAPTMILALAASTHYFKQYSEAGEYSDIIGGPTVLDVLKKQGHLSGE